MERLERPYVRLENDKTRERFHYSSPAFGVATALSYDEFGLSWGTRASPFAPRGGCWPYPPLRLATVHTRANAMAPGRAHLESFAHPSAASRIV